MVDILGLETALRAATTIIKIVFVFVSFPSVFLPPVIHSTIRPIMVPSQVVLSSCSKTAVDEGAISPDRLTEFQSVRSVVYMYIIFWILLLVAFGTTSRYFRSCALGFLGILGLK